MRGWPSSLFAVFRWYSEHAAVDYCSIPNIDLSAFQKCLYFFCHFTHFISLYLVPRFPFPCSPDALTCNKTPGLLLFTTIFIVLYIKLIINVITIMMPFVVNGRLLSSLLVMVWLYYVPLVKRMLNPHELQCKNDPSTCCVSENKLGEVEGGKAKLFFFFLFSCFCFFLNTNCFLAHGLCLKFMSFSRLFFSFPSCCIGKPLDLGCPGFAFETNAAFLQTQTVHLQCYWSRVRPEFFSWSFTNCRL